MLLSLSGGLLSGGGDLRVLIVLQLPGLPRVDDADVGSVVLVVPGEGDVGRLFDRQYLCDPGGSVVESKRRVKKKMSRLENVAVKMPEFLKEVHEYAFSRRQCLTLKVRASGASELKFTALQRQGSETVQVAEDYGPCEDLPSLAFFVDAFEALVVRALSSLGLPDACDTVRFSFDEEDDAKYVLWERLGDGSRQVLLSWRENSIDFLAARDAPFRVTKFVKRDAQGHIARQERVDAAPQMHARAMMIKFGKLFVLKCQSSQEARGQLQFSRSSNPDRRPRAVRADMHPMAVYRPGFNATALGVFAAELCSAIRLVAPATPGSNVQVVSKLRNLSRTANANFDPVNHFRRPLAETSPSGGPADL